MPDVLVFQRQSSEDRIIVAINIGNEEYTAHFDARAGQGTDLISGELIDFGGGLLIPAKKAFMIRTEEVSIS